MFHRSAKRVYTSPALEQWFRRLDCDWEQRFKPQELQSGRKLYRDGHIRAVELTEGDLIVHAQVDGRQHYAVVDWKRNRFEVRASTTHPILGKGLAVAGLYELEEMVCEEIPQRGLPQAKGDKQRSKDEEAPQKQAEHHAPAMPPTVATEGPQRLARRLVLEFQWNRRQVWFEARWQGPNGSRPLAFGPQAPDAQALSLPEREKIILLASVARRAGFFGQPNGRFTCGQLERLPGFIRSTLPQWRRRFEVRTPEGWERLAAVPREVELVASAREQGEGGLFSLAWEGRVGKQVLAAEELDWLGRQGPGLAILSSGMVARVTPETGELWASWREAQGSAGGLMPAYMLFSLFAQQEFPVQLDEPLQRWHETTSRADQAPALPVPEFLRAYQAAGVRWLAGLCEQDCHPLLADEMGLGKTVQILALLHARPITDLPSLIVCPASVVPVWQQEVARFFPETETRVLRKGEDFVASREPVLWLASYSQLRRHKPLLGDTEFGYAVLDEAQSIKNPEAKTTQACLALKARHRIALSGTPLENHPTDLWTLFRFLMPGLLGARRRFEQHWQTDHEEAAERLRRQTSPFTLRRTKSTVLKELPPKVESQLVCPLTDLQLSEYQRLAREGIGELGDQFKQREQAAVMPLLALLTRLRQVACDPGLLPWMDAAPEQSGKLVLLLERVREATESGHKVVVFSQFVTFLHRARSYLEDALSDVPMLELTGRTRDRATPVSTFQDTDGPAVIFVSLKAGGTGITLHAADYVFLLDPWWNPAVERQAIDRVHRIGQREQVFVYRMVAMDTVEARIEALKQRKDDLFADVLGDSARAPTIREAFDSLEELIALGAQG